MPTGRRDPRRILVPLVLVTLSVATNGCDEFYEEQDVIPPTTELVSINLTVIVRVALPYDDYLVPNARVDATAVSWQETANGPQVFDEKAYHETSGLYGTCSFPIRILVPHPDELIEITIKAVWSEREPPYYRGSHFLRFAGPDFPGSWTVELYLDRTEWGGA